MQKPCFPWILKRKKMMLQKWGTESCQIIKFARRGWITIILIRTTSAVRENSRQTINGYNGLWTEALFVEVHRASCRIAKKNENDSKIIIRKIKLRLKKQRNKKKKGQVSSKLKVIPLSSISPLFSKGFFTSIFNKYTATNDISNVCKSGGKHRKLHLIYDSLWKLLST